MHMHSTLLNPDWGPSPDMSMLIFIPWVERRVPMQLEANTTNQTTRNTTTTTTLIILLAKKPPQNLLNELRRACNWDAKLSALVDWNANFLAQSVNKGPCGHQRPQEKTATYKSYVVCCKITDLLEFWVVQYMVQPYATFTLYPIKSKVPTYAQILQHVQSVKICKVSKRQLHFVSLLILFV